MSLLHIVTESEWRSARLTGIHSPVSLQSEGFIHCSTDLQVLATASRWFRGRTDLWLLKLDEQALKPDLIFETPNGYSEAFPHLYAPLLWSSVVGISRFELSKEGEFQLPASWLAPNWDS